MINKTVWLGLRLGLSGGLLVTLTSCGFKSDLYLPGQPQKPAQYDSESLKDLGDEKLRELQNQGEVPDTVTNSDGNTGMDAGLDSTLDVPENGVVVELPSADDIARDKENPDKTTSDKSDSRKKVPTDN